MFTIKNKENKQGVIQGAGYQLQLGLKGMITGAAGILPGFSGGVMMLLFGVYEPLMEVLAHPVKRIKRHWRMLLPFILGIGIGFLLTAKVLADVFKSYELQSTCLFVGLVAGMFPALFRDARSKGRSKGSWVGFGISVAVLLPVLEYLQFSTQISVTPNFWWYIFCGILWGLSLIVPGMSSSSILMYLGLYIPLAAGLGNLNVIIAFPWLIGIGATVAVLPRLIDYVFKKYYSISRHCIIGIVLATTVPIIPLKYESLAQGMLCLMLAMLGFFLAWGIDLLDSKLLRRAEKTEEA